MRFALFASLGKDFRIMGPWNSIPSQTVCFHEESDLANAAREFASPRSGYKDASSKTKQKKKTDLRRPPVDARARRSLGKWMMTGWFLQPVPGAYPSSHPVGYHRMHLLYCLRPPHANGPLSLFGHPGLEMPPGEDWADVVHAARGARGFEKRCRGREETDGNECAQPSQANQSTGNSKKRAVEMRPRSHTRAPLAYLWCTQ